MVILKELNLGFSLLSLDIYKAAPYPKLHPHIYQQYPLSSKYGSGAVQQRLHGSMALELGDTRQYGPTPGTNLQSPLF